MCTSYSLSKHLVFVHILALQLLTQRVSSLNLTNAYLYHKCLVREGKYQPGSEYEKNFNNIIKSISTKLKDEMSVTYGTDPNVITIRIQCRGDSYGSKCRSCFATAVAGLRRRCQRNKLATIWYDQCFLHISSNDLPSPNMIDYKNNFFMQNPNNVSGDTKSFNKKVIDFFNKLMQKALNPHGPTVEFYAAGEERLGTNKLYAMVLCAMYPKHSEL